MPITAFSISMQRELDLNQWLAINGHSQNDDPLPLALSMELREKASADIVCSGCDAQGATLVRGGRSRTTKKEVTQGHFRFRTAAGDNPHDPMCEFFDEMNVRGSDYLTSFASDKSALTQAIRDIVCRGIAADILSQADMRSMRLWFLKERTVNSVQLNVTPELLQWCSDMQMTRAVRDFGSLTFIPEHGSLPGFNWETAARLEWARRNDALFQAIGRHVYFRSQSIERPLRLVTQNAGQVVLDPSCLQDKYDSAVKLSVFAANHLFAPGAKPPALTREHPSSWTTTQSHSLLALSALLLYMSNWNLPSASSLFCRLKEAPPTNNLLLGNLIGLNPFHDYQSWLLINAARRIGELRSDVRPVQEQVAEVKTQMQAQYERWVNSRRDL